MRVLIFLILIPLVVGFTKLPAKYQGYTDLEFKTILDSVKTNAAAPERKTPSRTKGHDGRLKGKVDKLEKEIKRLKGVGSFNPTFSSSYPPIATLSRFKGILEGNIVSSGQPVTFKVSIVETSKIPPDSYLACVGTNQAAKYNFRIVAKCKTLVTPSDEYDIDASLKDIKSVVGLKPDFVYTGEEEAILGTGFSAIASGIIDASMDRTLTATGFATDPTLKNNLLNGFAEAARQATQKGQEHTENKTVVLAVETNTPVIVEFNRRFTYEKN